MNVKDSYIHGSDTLIKNLVFENHDNKRCLKITWAQEGKNDTWIEVGTVDGLSTSVTKNFVYAGPDGSTGHTANATPTFRKLVAADIPDLSATYLPLAGGTLTGPIEIKSTISGNYNEGLRITRAANNWAGITFGSIGLSGTPTNGWFVATTPDNQFIISPDSNSNTTGLTLNKDGDILWCNNKLWHSGNVTISDYVTLNTTQTITDLKIFTGGVQFKGSNEAHAIVTDNDANLVFDTLNNIVYTGGTSLLLATFKNGGTIYGTLTAVPNEEQGLYYNNHRLLTADNAFVDLYSNSEYLIAISIGNVIKKLSTSSIKSNLGLGQLAYKNSLTYTDVNAASSNHTHAYLPLSGGTMTGQIRRSYTTASTQPMIYAYAANNDVNLIRIGYSESTAGVAKLSADYGFTLKYLGTGSDNNNALQILADNQTGTQVIALSILQDGSATFANKVKATTFDGNATSATNATNVAISTKNDNVNYYLPFVSNTSGNLPLYVDNTGTLTYNPSTGTLTTTKFKGALEGNANTATTATNATKIAVTADNTATEQYLVFVNGTSGNLAAHIDNAATGILKYQPSTGTLSYQVASIGGNASVGGNLTVTGNTTISGNTTLGDAATDSVTVNAYLNVASISQATSAIARPIWFSFAADANGYTVGRPAYHTSFTYNPNTGTVAATKFSGTLSGNATTASNLTDGSAQSRFGILYQSGASTTSATNPGASVTPAKYLGATTNANGAITPTWTSLDTTVTQNSRNLVTSGAVFSAIANKVAGAVQYLGTVATSDDMIKLTAAGYGDFARVTSSFKIGNDTAHVGDIVILTSNAADGYATATNWAIAHVEIDTNTWNAVSFTANGYVPMYSAANSTDSTSANTYHFLGYQGTAATSTTLKWYSLPANAFNNTNTWRSIVCDSNTATGTSTSSGVLKFVSGTNISLGWTNTSNSPTITVNHGAVTCTTTAAAAANSGTALSHSGEFVVPTAVTVSNQGHVTALTWTRYKLPASGNTDYTGIALKTNTTYGTKKTDTTLLKAASSTGLWIKGGTNKFLIGDGTNYIEVGVTPSITNNITGSGTSGNLAKFNGNNTITSGPALSSAITSQNQSTKFLREDGTWAAPSYTNNTHRPIQYNGAEILGNNTTALNFVAGSNITITPEQNADKTAYTGKITIAAKDTKYNVVTNAVNGLVKAPNNDDANVSSTKATSAYYVYGISSKNGTPTWYKLPDAAFSSNTDTMVTTASTTAKMYIIGKSDANKEKASTALYDANLYVTNGALRASSLSTSGNVTATGKVTGSNLWDIDVLANAVSMKVSQSSWTEVCSLTGKESGTYVLSISNGNTVASGIISIVKNTTANVPDETALHVYSADATTGRRFYARTDAGKLYIASSDSAETILNITVKIRRII